MIPRDRILFFTFAAIALLSSGCGKSERAVAVHKPYEGEPVSVAGAAF
jgi:hypothetical protein